MELVGYLLTGGAAAAGIKLIETLSVWLLNRRAAKKDKAEGKTEANKATEAQRVKDLEEKIGHLEEGQRAILHDRIKYLCRAYLEDKEISFEDREDLLKMHKAYHNLGGNGNLDKLMEAVMLLPLSK